MNRKVLLSIVGILVVLFICGVASALLLFNRAQQVISNTTSKDPEIVSEVADDIIDFELPASYTQSVSMSLLGITMAGFTTQDEHNAILLFKIPTNNQVSADQIRRQINEMAEKQTGESYSLEQTGSQQVTISGQTVNMDIYEGTSSSGMVFRQMMGTFEGKNGPAWLMILAPADSWDQAALDAFFASIH